MIIDCALYREGERVEREVPLHEAYQASCEAESFVWLGMYEPSVEEFTSVRDEFQLHSLAIEDAVTAHQRPKLETYGDTLFLVLKTARYVDEDDSVDFGEIMLFVGEGFLISVRHGQAAALDDVRHRLEQNRDILRFGPGAALHAIVDKVVDGYQPVIEGLDNDIQEVERDVFSDTRQMPTERIYKLLRETLEFDRDTSPLAGPLSQLANGEFKLVQADLQNYFRDVLDHAERAIDEIHGIRDLLRSVLEANLTQVGVQQNNDMRKITSWAAILAVPTAIAGIYGMNFDYMPELHWVYGYPLALGMMAVSCFVLYRAFRRSGWL